MQQLLLHRRSRKVKLPVQLRWLHACLACMIHHAQKTQCYAVQHIIVWVSTLTIWHKSRGTIPHRMRALMGGELHGP
jgi:hypothetical protein